MRSDIQGLRALAVLSVVLFHATGGAWASGGFLGVDIFFVVSGYLICRQLLKAPSSDGAALLAFYRRRVRRLFPALLVMLLVTLAAGAVLLSPTADRLQTAPTERNPWRPRQIREAREHGLGGCGHGQESVNPCWGAHAL
eukprot:gene38489-51997_t